MTFELSFLGLIITLIYITLTGYYPGGIVVPSYLVLFLDQPQRIAGTWIAAILTVLCYKGISRYMILFGKRRFVMMILLGGLWTFAATSLFPFFLPVSMEFRVIGWIIPGLIANQFERQGIGITTASIATVTVSIFLLGQLLVKI